jgi:hypothetical protein
MRNFLGLAGRYVYMVDFKLKLLKISVGGLTVERLKAMEIRRE